MSANKPSHLTLGEEWRDGHRIDDHDPVFTLGALHMPTAEGIWQPWPTAKVEHQLAHAYRIELPRYTDHVQARKTVENLAWREGFFESAPDGIAAGESFYRIDAEGELIREPLTLEHRQRFRLPFEPSDECYPELTLGLLRQALEGDDQEEQELVFWQSMGCAVMGLMWRFQVALLLMGKPRSGKSVCQSILQALLPPDAVSAVPLHRLGHEYYSANLAGARVNIGGEVEAGRPIEAGPFKNVTSGGMEIGRHPNGRPFTYQARASQVHGSNVLPHTTDRSQGFFRRFRIVHYKHQVPEGSVDPHLIDKIKESEMPGVLAKMLSAASDAVRNGRIATSPSHQKMIEKWALQADPVRQWLNDPEAVLLDRNRPAESGDGNYPTTTKAYEHFRAWCRDAGFSHILGRNHFLELVDDADHGVRLTRTDKRLISGLELLKPPPKVCAAI